MNKIDNTVVSLFLWGGGIGYGDRINNKQTNKSCGDMFSEENESAMGGPCHQDWGCYPKQGRETINKLLFPS